VGEGQDPTGHSPSASLRVSVQEAAEQLGTTVDAIRKRVQRNTIRHEKDAGGRVWIFLDADRTRHDTDQDTAGLRQDGESNALISEMHDRIRFLEDELQRKDAILLNMTEAMKALSPPERESPETVEEASEAPEPHPATEEPQEGVQRPWWRRIFG
jgi:excisionase family DNA binding protein